MKVQCLINPLGITAFVPLVISACILLFDSDTLKRILRNSKDAKYEGNKKVFLENPEEDNLSFQILPAETRRQNGTEKPMDTPKMKWSENVSASTKQFRQKYWTQLVSGFWIFSVYAFRISLWGLNRGCHKVVNSISKSVTTFRFKLGVAISSKVRIFWHLWFWIPRIGLRLVSL